MEASKQESVTQPEAQTGDAVALSDVRVGDELICRLATGRMILTRVKRVKRSRGGELVAFFPCAQLGVDSSIPIELTRVVKAWRSPQSKRE